MLLYISLVPSLLVFSLGIRPALGIILYLIDVNIANTVEYTSNNNNRSDNHCFYSKYILQYTTLVVWPIVVVRCILNSISNMYIYKVQNNPFGCPFSSLNMTLNENWLTNLSENLCTVNRKDFVECVLICWQKVCPFPVLTLLSSDQLIPARRTETSGFRFWSPRRTCFSIQHISNHRTLVT